jgi:hypothetical protein
MLTSGSKERPEVQAEGITARIRANGLLIVTVDNLLRLGVNDLL